MSRAFVNEDAGDHDRGLRWELPPPDDPSYDASAALALLEGARDGNAQAAEEATGYHWGDPQLHPHVRRLMDKELERPLGEQDARFLTLARRFLRG